MEFLALHHATTRHRRDTEPTEVGSDWIVGVAVRLRPLKQAVDRPEDVDEPTERARAAAARVTKEPVAAEFFQCRDAYFADPEGGYWEVRGRPSTIR